ncbi:hypothetical protein BD289DRAFT_12951 [Coniella lustricola]|uniref:Cytochrome P450 n=1 Tax=Coniella lustricola TaxID=2025994 RepID=A0A2T3A427_9PEZI|nr:hypothetical protein BD289DRAFT_12951 [Coniella lustricola]
MPKMFLIDYVGALLKGIQQLVPAITALATIWLGWRFCTFTLWPALHPQRPKPLPYLVPVLTHVFGMSKNAAALYTRGREYFGNTREIFSVTVMGEVLYIVTSPSDVQALYKEPKLSFEAVIAAVMADFGCSPDTVEKMFNKEGKLKTWMDVSHDDFRYQMHPGKEFAKLNEAFLINIEFSLKWDKITGFPVTNRASTGKLLTVSLWKWCYTVLVDAATRSMFGNAIFEVYPDVMENFYMFDQEGWKLPFKYPEFAAKTLYRTLGRSKTAFADFLALPEDQRQDSCWIVKRLEDGMKDVGIIDPAQCGVMLFVLHRL